MISNLLSALIGNYMTTCFVLGLVVGAVQVVRLGRHPGATAISGLLLNAYLVWAIGVAEAVNFVMHSVFGDFAARTIGWAQSPFQLELAFSSLGIAVMAFILHGTRSQLRAKAALVIAVATFSFGAAGGHVYQLVVNHDHAANNGGLLLVMDVVIAAAGLALLVWHAAARRHRTDPTDATLAAQHLPAAA